MSADSTSIQFSATYGSTMVRPPSVKHKHKIEIRSLENMVELPVERTDEVTWEDFWHLETTETAAGDGTVTRTMSGSLNFDMWGMRGTSAFSVSVTFNPDDYQPGELEEKIDLLAAAHEAAKAAWRSASSGAALDKRLHQLDTVYEQRKKETASSFACMVGGRLEAELRTGEEEQKVYKSVQALFASYESRYRSVIAGNSQGSWMTDRFSVSVANLRMLSASAKADSGAVNGLYSLRELEAAAAKVCQGFSIRG